VDAATDRFRVTILHSEAEETPEEVRVGYRQLGRLIAERMRAERIAAGALEDVDLGLPSRGV